MDCQGKTYVITGATAGIGLATAEIMFQRGADIIGVGRSAERCRQAEARLRAINPQSQVNFIQADLSAQSAVRQLAKEIERVLDELSKPGLDGLANNAGTFTYWLTLTAEGLETQWAVNHLAPFLLTHLLLKRLQTAPQARVVTTSSGSHYAGKLNWNDPQLRRRYNGLRAYENTKLANVLFTHELNRRLGQPSRVRAFAADPGLVKTDIGFKGTPGLVNWVWKVRRSAGISAEEAARGVAFLLTEPEIQQSPASYWRHCCPLKPSRAALNEQDASRLWMLSAKMVGLEA